MISTYYREDGKSYEYLSKSLNSIKNQTYKNYKIFLMGDKYEKPDEIQFLISQLELNNIVFENLSYAKERDKYSGRLLWSYGGVNALNIGIKMAMSENINYICHLDHDDSWLEEHLELINNCIVQTNADWVCTKSTFLNAHNYLPKVLSQEIFIPFSPKQSALIHSSVCMNFRKIPLFYRDVYEETGTIGLPGDADLWERCRTYIESNNLKSYLVNKITCEHEEEGYSLKK